MAALAGVLRKGRESEDGRGKRERGEGEDVVASSSVSAFDGKRDEFPPLVGLQAQASTVSTLARWGTSGGRRKM
jgi:hypothetical protein